MAILKDIKFFQAGGMDLDSAIEYRAKNDYGEAYNIRTTGTQKLEDGYITNIESNVLLSASVPPGINRCIGSAGFEDRRIGIGVFYNSLGNNSIREINFDTNEVTVIPIPEWPLNPDHYVDDIKLINDTFLLMNDAFNPPFYVNYDRLKAGVYSTMNDLMLIKPQPQFPPTAIYGDDNSRSVNLIDNKQFQFRSAFIGLDFETSCVSTISQRFVPPFDATPGNAADVTKNNNLTISVDAGTDKTKTLLIDALFADLSWFNIVTIDRSEILSLPLLIDIPNKIYQAYNPITNIYYFVFFNDGLYENIDALITDQLFDNVPLVAGALEILNGNQTVLGNITVGYDRPNTPVSLTTSNYNPNLTLPSSGHTPFQFLVTNPGQSGSGLGNHRRLVVIEFGGFINEGDKVQINLVDIRNSSNVQSFNLPPCTIGDVNDVANYIITNSVIIPNTSTFVPAGGETIGINIITAPFFTLQSVVITLFNAGSGIFKSIHALKGNSSYQVALLHYDFWGRPFPIQTNSNFILNTDSYGQSHGNTPQINWKLLSDVAPEGAYTYQWAISPNATHLTWLSMLASIIQVAETSPGLHDGTYNASTNTFNPSSSGKPAGTAWRVTASGSQNLGGGQLNFSTGDWVVAEGSVPPNPETFGLIPSTFGDLSDSTAYYFYFNTLNNYNIRFNSSILSYDFTQGDRATLYYYDNSGTLIFFDGISNPIIDVQVEGYDASVFFLKVDRSASIDPSVLIGHNVFLEIYTPKPRTSTSSTGATTNNPTVFFEIGTAYKIVNGKYTVLSDIITQGDNYFKTRQVTGSVDINHLYTLIVEDPNYSDFNPSKFYSFGRPRSFKDALPRTSKIASIVFSEPFIIGSENNGLTTFFPENIYGEQGGQTSSNHGAIQLMAQINNDLLVIQDIDHCTVPVFTNVIEDNVQTENIAISEKILGTARYTNGRRIGIGKGKSTFALYNNIAYWIDSNRNEPIRRAPNGATPISEKMSKYFKDTFAKAFSQGLKVIGWYDVFNDEYVVSTQQPGGIVQSIAFKDSSWQFLSQFSVLPSEIILATSPLHSSPSYNNVTGIVVIVPDINYVGSDSFEISFPESPSTVNVCYNWTAGSAIVNDFSFISLIDVPLSTVEYSNAISVFGNDFPVPISITGDTGLGYSINGGAFTSSAGTVNAGDIVVVKVTSSASNYTLTSCTLTIDSKSSTFNVTTVAAAPTNNFTVTAGSSLGLTINSVHNGTTTGVPAGFTGCNLSPGMTLALPYTTVTAGTIIVNMSGTPTPPTTGTVNISLYVNGIRVDTHTDAGGTGDRTLTLGSTTNNPTTILVKTEFVP